MKRCWHRTTVTTLLISLGEVITSTGRFAASIAARKMCGRGHNRSGGTKSPRDSFTRRRFDAAHAAAKIKNGRQRHGGSTWRASPEKTKSAKGRERENHHDDPSLVPLGAALGRVCVFDGDLCEDRS